MSFQQSPVNNDRVQQQAKKVTRGINVGCSVFALSLISIPFISALVAVILSAITGQKNNSITGTGAYFLFLGYLLTPGLIMGIFYAWFRKKNKAYTKSFLWTSIIIFVIYFLILLMLASVSSKFGGAAQFTSSY